MHGRGHRATRARSRGLLHSLQPMAARAFGVVDREFTSAKHRGSFYKRPTEPQALQVWASGVESVLT